MELRRFSVCLAFLLVAAVTQCSEARHSLERRDANYEDGVYLSDGVIDTEQNDADTGDDEGDSMPNATILSRPQAYNLTIGRSVRLECSVDIKNTVVDWTKDGKDIVKLGFLMGSSDKYDFNSTASSDLIVKSVEVNDSGIYRCRLNQGLPMQVDHSVVVSEPPMVVNITATDNGSPREGSDLLLTCNVNGSPQPNIVWSVMEPGSAENRKLTEKDGQFNQNSVFIQNVKREHSGIYICYAFNPVGFAQKKINIVVQGKPRIEVHRLVVNSIVNVEATLQCNVHESLPVVITWFKDGKLINSRSNIRITTAGTHSNLTVIPESDADFGTYTCQAECDIGVHSRSIELVQRPVVEELEAQGPKLSFRVHSHQQLEGIEVQLKPLSEEGEWKTFTVPPPQNRDHEYEISYKLEEALNPGRYEAVVKVKNTKEWSQVTDLATTVLNIDEPQPIIQGASVYRGNDAPAHRPTTVLLSTVLMYLLVRML